MARHASLLAPDEKPGKKKTFPLKTITRVWSYAKAYPGLMWGTFLCAIISTGAGFVFPRAAGLVIDKVLVPHRKDLLLPYVLLVVGSFFVRDMLNGLRIWFNNNFEQKVIFDLRRDLYAKLQRLPLSWYDQRATGDIITRLIDDVTNMERVLIDGVEQGLIASMQIIGIGGVLFFTNAYLATWMLVPMPVLVVGVLWYTRTAKSRYREQRKAASDMNSLLVDNLQGIRLIKSYAKEEDELARFSKSAQSVADTQLVIMRTWAWYTNSMTFVESLGVPIVLFVGGLASLNSGAQFSNGELVTFVLYVAMFYEPIGKLHQLNQLYQAGRAAGERVNEILDTISEENEGAASVQVIGSSVTLVFADRKSIKGRVEYKNVSFSYRPDLPALTDINLVAEPGQMIALVGPTGAGKTTFVALLNRFYELTGGSILIDGHDIKKMSLNELRSHIGLVSQETFLFNGTVLDNLRFARPSATKDEIIAAAEAACVHEFVKRLPEGYDTAVGERGVKLSVGEKQRISIARALLKDAPILVLDEATASVDTATERLIQEALGHLLKNRTSFVIAHRLSTIREADLILVLKTGKVIERGNHDELLSQNGVYADLIQKQTDPWTEQLEYGIPTPVSGGDDDDEEDD